MRHIYTLFISGFISACSTVNTHPPSAPDAAAVTPIIEKKAIQRQKKPAYGNDYDHTRIDWAHLQHLQRIVINNPSEEAFTAFRNAYRAAMQDGVEMATRNKPAATAPRSMGEQVYAAAQIVPTPEPASILTERPAYRAIYFDFDSSAINEKWRAILSANASYLIANSNIRVTVAGFTDARGTGEYNLRLGYRRAEGVAEALKRLGVRDEQITVASYGYSHQVSRNKDESAMAADRRVEIMY